MIAHFSTAHDKAAEKMLAEIHNQEEKKSFMPWLTVYGTETYLPSFVSGNNKLF